MDTYFNKTGKNQVTFEKILENIQLNLEDRISFDCLYSIYVLFHEKKQTIHNNEDCKKYFDILDEKNTEMRWYLNELSKSRDEYSYQNSLENMMDIFLIKIEGKY